MSPMLNNIQCEKSVLQQNELDTQSSPKEYSTSMSEKKLNQHRFPPGSLYRRPSEVAPNLPSPAHQKRTSHSHLPFQPVRYSIPTEGHPQRNEDSFFLDAASVLIACFNSVCSIDPQVS